MEIFHKEFNLRPLAVVQATLINSIYLYYQFAINLGIVHCRIIFFKNFYFVNDTNILNYNIFSYQNSLVKNSIIFTRYNSAKK